MNQFDPRVEISNYITNRLNIAIEEKFKKVFDEEIDKRIQIKVKEEVGKILREMARLAE